VFEETSRDEIIGVLGDLVMPVLLDSGRIVVIDRRSGKPVDHILRVKTYRGNIGILYCFSDKKEFLLKSSIVE
jgi:hypothetical protein